MLSSFFIFVNAIVYEAKLGFFEGVLEFIREIFCKACNQAVFCQIISLPFPYALIVFTKPSKYEHGVFEEVRAKHLLEKFYWLL